MILHRHRYTEQRWQRTAALQRLLRLAGRRQGVVSQHGDVGVQVSVQTLDAGQIRLHHVHRRHLLGRDRLSGLRS